MIKDKNGNYFLVNKIIGNDRQLTVTIALSNWKFFEIGSKIKAISMDGKDEFYRRIRSISNGRQRNISIPKEEWNRFKKGDKIKIFPEKQPTLNKTCDKVSKSQDDSMDKQNDNKQNNKFKTATD